LSKAKQGDPFLRIPAKLNLVVQVPLNLLCILFWSLGLFTTEPAETLFLYAKQDRYWKALVVFLVICVLSRIGYAWVKHLNPLPNEEERDTQFSLGAFLLLLALPVYTVFTGALIAAHVELFDKGSCSTVTLNQYFLLIVDNLLELIPADVNRIFGSVLQCREVDTLKAGLVNSAYRVFTTVIVIWCIVELWKSRHPSRAGT
jgi:hypothetical protein